MLPSGPSRHAALKAQHRAAILEAARSLMAEGGTASLRTDDLVERADVARRTLFNHFGSLDEVALTVCTDTLTVMVDDFIESVSVAALGDGSRSSMFAELAAALHGSDLPTAMAEMVRMLGGAGPSRARATELSNTAFARVGDRLAVEVARRHPAADPLDVRLLVASLVSGIAVIADRWVTSTGARLDSASRAEWDQLLARLVHSLRSGYIPL